MARFQVTFAFEREDVATWGEALAYAQELAADEMMQSGELVEVVEAEII